MELMWIIYLIEVVASIKLWGLGDILAIITVFTIVYTAVSAMRADLNRDVYFKDCMNAYFNILKKKIIIIPLLVIFGFGSLFNNIMPSKETAYLMLGAYGVQTVAETVGKNEDVQRLGKRTLSLVETAIEKYEKELSVEEPKKTVDSKTK